MVKDDAHKQLSDMDESPRIPPSASTQNLVHRSNPTLSDGFTSSDPTYLPLEYTSISAYKTFLPGVIAFYVLSVLSLGILPIVAFRIVKVRVWLTRKAVTSFVDAEWVLVNTHKGAYEEVPVMRIQAPLNNGGVGVLFGEEGEEVLGVDVDGVVEEGREDERKVVYGFTQKWTEPDSHRFDSYRYNARRQISQPFYLFQFASVIIWFFQDYTAYALIILMMSFLSIIWEIFTAKTNEKSLRDLATSSPTVSTSSTPSISASRASILTTDVSTTTITLQRPKNPCTVLRDGRPTEIDVTQLVVGDAVILDTPNINAVADMVIVQGGVVVDESSLTGEATPVYKFPLPVVEAGFGRTPGEGYSPERNKGSTVFGGSKILELKPAKHVLARPGEDWVKVVGIVTATGFYSTRGELFRSILFPKELDFKFYKDSFKFIAALSFVALLAFINRVVNGLARDLPTFWVLVTSLDLITIAVPPALPLILTVGIGMALQRLKLQNIFCISPERINYAGRIDVFCWDKTGTLTTPRLTWAGLDASTTTPPTERPSTSSTTSPSQGPYLEGHRQTFGEDHANLERAVAVCHTLNEIQEIELFNATKWKMVQDEHQLNTLTTSWGLEPIHPIAISPRNHHNPPSSFQISRPSTNLQTTSPLLVLKRYEFDAQLQRCSVVFRTRSTVMACVKGSPESVLRVCQPASVPRRYHETYTRYAAKGYYVLAVAERVMKDWSVGVKREGVEREMRFLGFVMLMNPLKPESEAVVSVLGKRGFGLSLCELVLLVYETGDGSMTAISVCRELDICSNVILIDIFDHGLGFQRLKDDSNHVRQDKEVVVSQEKVPILEGESRDREADTGDFDEDEMEFYDSGSHQNLTERTPPMIQTKLPASLTISNGISKTAKISTPTLTSALSFPIEELGRTIATLETSERWEMAITGAALDAMTGGNFEDGFLDWVVWRCSLFARMKPGHKSWIVERLIRQGRYVGMCGDGANDTGALKAAHVGLALSDSEASIVAPFTSVQRRVSDVIKLVAEGRCALDTSFIAFKYMFMYPIVQLTMVATLNQMGSGLSNNQFLFDDMAIVLVLAILMLRSSSSPKLGASRPTDNLFSPIVLASIFGHVFICVGFFAANVASLYDQPWYCAIWKAKVGVDETTWLPKNASAPYNETYPCYFIDPTTDVTGSNLVTTHENTAIWLFTHFQFAILALVFCFSSPHRRPAWTNLSFITYLLVCLICLAGMLLLSDDELGFAQFALLFNIREGVPRVFRVGVLVLAVMGFKERGEGERSGGEKNEWEGGDYIAGRDDIDEKAEGEVGYGSGDEGGGVLGKCGGTKEVFAAGKTGVVKNVWSVGWHPFCLHIAF
ncbi:hypothetical protein BC829DRAFT_432106 [Chytridium lagenaria]|nr:hypothetical protein BC829DRAFT_432106 [Chytridium lagenaria]